MTDADNICFNKIITRDETWCFAYGPETKRKISEWRHVDIFFDSQGVLHKEFVPEEKIGNAKFYKGVMDRLLKRIQRVRPAAFCSRDFFCCTIIHPATKLQVFANF